MVNIGNIVDDYSKWDDSYEFINDSNKEYIYENFREGTTTLEDLDIDYIIYADLKNHILFSKYHNDSLLKNKKDFEQQILEKFQNSSTANTIIQYKNHYLYLVKSEIMLSDETGEANGYIFSGNIITNHNLHKRTKIFTHILLENRVQKGHKLDFSYDFLKDIKVKTTYNDTNLINNIHLYDHQNNYVFSLITENRREIVINGKNTINTFNLIIFILLFFTLYVIYRKQMRLDHHNKLLKDEITKNEQHTTQLMQQSRLAQAGEMMSMIAHQWRQPLAAISAIISNYELEQALDNQKPPHKYTKRMGDISSLVQHLAKTIDDFRSFYKPNRQQTRCTVKKSIIKALSLIEPSLKVESVTVTESYKSNTIINIYENELIQVFLNIFKNAQDNFNEKSIEDRMINIEVYDKKGQVTIKILDNGGGIPKDIITKIFDPYFSTKLDMNGTGLGLYMSKMIIQEHLKGSIKAINTKNGAGFIIRIPIENV